jgi:hypothetical protein
MNAPADERISEAVDNFLERVERESITWGL